MADIISGQLKLGRQNVVTSDAESFKTLKVDYPKLMEKSTADLPFKVLHITEYIDQLMKDNLLQFSKAVPMKVTYHDPCNLGRLSEPWLEWEPRYELPILP